MRAPSSLSLLAEFGWDPQIRGIVIIVTAVAILPGSVYLLLGHEHGCPHRVPARGRRVVAAGSS